MSITTGIVLFDDFEELDAIGPYEVFGVAASENPEDRVVTISERGGMVTGAKGLKVQVDHSFEDAPRLDVVLVPGGQGTRREVSNRHLLDWIAKTSESCTWTTSVCTGSLLLVEAGPARGKRVTTHWNFVEMLRERGGAAEVVDDMRFVRDGQVVTSAGISAGIDMALWLIGQIHGPAFARRVQRRMEYDPAPPYAFAA